MGVRMLWEVLHAGRAYPSMFEVAMLPGRAGKIRLAVHAKELAAEAVNQVLSHGINPLVDYRRKVLEILFQRLSDFLLLPMSLVFVFDGNRGPSFKPLVEVDKSSKVSWWNEPLRNMITAFGYHTHEAPGDSVAELAALSIAQSVDAILTSDNMSLIFGATALYRTISSEPGAIPGNIEIKRYFIEDIRRQNLTKQGLCLFALLQGSGYGFGATGCHPAIAFGLARCGFGERLVEAVEMLEADELELYLLRWRSSISQELQTNSMGYLPPQAHEFTLPLFFPELRLVTLFSKPLTSSTSELKAIPPSLWSSVKPNVAEIARFCHFRLGWTDSLENRLEEFVYQGVVLQMLYSPQILWSPDTGFLQSPHLQARLVAISWTNFRHGIPEYMSTLSSFERGVDVSVSTDGILNMIHPYLQAGATRDGEQWTVTIPQSLLPEILQTAWARFGTGGESYFEVAVVE